MTKAYSKCNKSSAPLAKPLPRIPNLDKFDWLICLSPISKKIWMSFFVTCQKIATELTKIILGLYIKFSRGSRKNVAFFITIVGTYLSFMGAISDISTEPHVARKLSDSVNLKVFNVLHKSISYLQNDLSEVDKKSTLYLDKRDRLGKEHSQNQQGGYCYLVKLDFRTILRRKNKTIEALLSLKGKPEDTLYSLQIIYPAWGIQSATSQNKQYGKLKKMKDEDKIDSWMAHWPGINKSKPLLIKEGVSILVVDDDL
ncbi:hypothetical protein CPB84DRAFT_1745980 [Gymnopilus junonius]|uniref:Uncharacterized protein n=1 Tax=Gymnopilus junonius TaxID=109634 RepID=A0A9P5TQ20_GYMJU|nr:hypothetical protein CPB84DRAFT_1745980 [Gymnopilus junonius]